ASLRIKRIAYHLVSISLETGICNTDVRRAVFIRSKNPLDRSHGTIVSPFNQNPLIYFYLFDIYLDRNVVHFPRPGNALAGFQWSATFGEPKAVGDFGINKSLENFRHRLADKHLGFCSGHLG